MNFLERDRERGMLNYAFFKQRHDNSYYTLIVLIECYQGNADL